MKTKYLKGWSSHMPVLIRFLEKSTLPILELGSGIFSTPFLHWYSREKKLQLFTYEDNSEFFNFADQYKSKNHHIRLTKDWEDIEKIHWGVVLIDQSTENRAKTAIALKDSADYIILHDSQDEKTYGYDEVYKHFKYRYDYKEAKPWTTVVSNFKDLSNLKK